MIKMETRKIFLLAGEKSNQYLITRLHTLCSFAGYKPYSDKLQREQIHMSKLEFKVAPVIENCDGHFVARNTDTNLSNHSFVRLGTIMVCDNHEELSKRVYRLARDIAMKLSEQPGFYGEKFEFENAVPFEIRQGKEWEAGKRMVKWK